MTKDEKALQSAAQYLVKIINDYEEGLKLQDWYDSDLPLELLCDEDSAFITTVVQPVWNRLASRLNAGELLPVESEYEISRERLNEIREGRKNEQGPRKPGDITKCCGLGHLKGRPDGLFC